jgi:hypothetical protein
MSQSEECKHIDFVHHETNTAVVAKDSIQLEVFMTYLTEQLIELDELVIHLLMG